MVDNIITPHDKMHKRHMSLSFHSVREAISAEIANYLFVDGKNNTADVLTKHWDCHDIWTTLKPSCFGQGVLWSVSPMIV